MARKEKNQILQLSYHHVGRRDSRVIDWTYFWCFCARWQRGAVKQALFVP